VRLVGYLKRNVYCTVAHLWSHYEAGYLQNSVYFTKGRCVTLN